MTTLRMSNYLVLVPIPDDPTRFLAHHGIRGGCEIVSDDEAAFLLSHASVESHAPLYGKWIFEPVRRPAFSPPSPAEARITALTKSGFLTAWTEAEEEALFMLAIRRVHQKSLAAAVGYNFVLSYEQASGGTSKEEEAIVPLRRNLLPEMIDRICASLEAFEADVDLELGGESPRRVGIVGDNSLVAENRHIVEHLIKRVTALGTSHLWGESTGEGIEELAGVIGPDGLRKISFNWRGTLVGGSTHQDDRESVRTLGRAIEIVLARDADVLLKLHLTPQVLRTLPHIGELISRRGLAEEPRFELKLIPYETSSPAFDDQIAARKESAELSLDLDAIHPALQRLTSSTRTWMRPDRSILEEELDVVSKLISDHRFHAYVFDPYGNIYLSTKEAGDPRLRIGEVIDVGQGSEIRFVGSASLMRTSPRSEVGKAAPACRRCAYGIHCGWGTEVRGFIGTREKGNACDSFGAHFRNTIGELAPR